MKSIVTDLFGEPRGRDGVGEKVYGKGKTYHIKLVIDRQDTFLDRRSSALDPFLNTLREHIPPDFGIDFALEGLRENDGLTFIHRKTRTDTDIYFVTNIQDRCSKLPVTFRVKNAIPWNWNPYNGDTSRIYQYRESETGTVIAVKSCAPYESTFIIFQSGDRIRIMWNGQIWIKFSTFKIMQINAVG